MNELFEVRQGELVLGVVRHPLGPNNVMSSWRLIQLQLPGGRRARYLVGDVNGQAHVCPDVIRIDLHTLRAEVGSGRVYELQDPGHDFDADFLLVYWMRLNSISQAKDLTRAVLRLKARRARASDVARQGSPANANGRRPRQARLF